MISQHTRELILCMLEFDEKNRVPWETLFDEYLPESNNSDMLEEDTEVLMHKLRKINQHFTFSVAIESEFHVNYMLLRNNKPVRDFAASCSTAREYFEKLKQIKNEEAVIEPIVDYYVENRNKNAFTMKLFI
jgi:hypothetical protein